MLVGDVIRQFKFVKIDDFRHPLLSSGRTVGVNVHPFWHFGVSLSRHHPARVVKFIPAVVSRNNIHQQNIFGLFVQARASDFKRREHSPMQKREISRVIFLISVATRRIRLWGKILHNFAFQRNINFRHLR